MKRKKSPYKSCCGGFLFGCQKRFKLWDTDYYTNERGNIYCKSCYFRKIDYDKKQEMEQFAGIMARKMAEEMKKI
jgi:hypothetical protein